jgi:lipopolysaccharide/colanic/teichoic acid biosynthesis glycosyltransferase
MRYYAHPSRYCKLASTIDRNIIRILDVLLSSLLLLLLSPLLLCCALAIRLFLGSPVFFRQRRAGLGGQAFEIIKFRTMLDATTPEGRLLPDEQRLTKIGSLLRKTSIDELPELINVVRGEMSLVGPRPLFPEYAPYYRERERLRFTIRPGLTGLAQISGRNYLGWDNKLELDAQYAEKISFGFYLKILIATPLKLFEFGGVAANPYLAEKPLNVERGGVDAPPVPAQTYLDSPIEK